MASLPCSSTAFLSRTITHQFRPFTPRHSLIAHLTHSTLSPPLSPGSASNHHQSCPCTVILPPSPILPEKFPIDTTSPLNNTSPAFHTHLLLLSGKSDWPSKIDFDPEHGATVTALRKALKAREASILQRILAAATSKATGTTNRVEERKVLLGLASFASTTAAAAAPSGGSSTLRAVLFPQGRIVDFPRLAADQWREENAMIAGLADVALSCSISSPPRSPSSAAATATSSAEAKKINGITILLCSHGGRDVRCGLLGPYLQECITRILAQNAALRERFAVSEDLGMASFTTATTAPTSATSSTTIAAVGEGKEEEKSKKIPVNIGLVSHIGGHKWAGNMIIYFPPDTTATAVGDKVDRLQSGSRKDGRRAVKGIWYGRINEGNIERVLEKTLLGWYDGAEEANFVEREVCRRVVY